MAPTVLSWDLDVPGPLTRAWALFGDTDRFNRLAGLPYRFDVSPGENGLGVVGHTRELGMSLSWDEVAFDFEAPHRYRIERVFRGGLVAKVEVHLHLEAAADRVRVTYRIEATPRAAVLRPLVWAALQIGSKPKLQGALNALATELEGVAVSAEHLPEGLPEGFREAYGAWLSVALPEDLDRMQAYPLAHRWGLPVHEVVEGFLCAADHGSVALRWDLLCPACLGADNQLETLDLSARLLHCPTCSLAYKTHGLEGIAVSFRGAGSAEAKPLCVGSPARTPQVRARVDLPPGGSTVWELELEPGAWRLREATRLDAVAIDVDRSGFDTLVVRVEGSLAPARAALRAGRVTLVLENRRDMPVRLVLEPRGVSEVLTAGRLLTTEAWRERLPAGALADQLDLRPAEGTVVATELLRDREVMGFGLKAWGQRPSLQALSIGERLVVASFGSADDALAATRMLEGVPEVCSAMGHGQVLMLVAGEQRVPLGAVVDATIDALGHGLPGRTTALGPSLAHEALAGALGREQIGVIEGPTLRGAADSLLVFPGHVPASIRRKGAPTEPVIGRLLRGRWLLGAEVGRGGYGIVYAATDPTTGEQAVAKLLHAELALDPLITQRLFLEARAASQVRHPRLPALYDWGHTDDGRVWLLLERLHGHELDPAAPITAAEVCRLAMDVLDALGALHALTIVHRDVKPSNLFVEKDGRVRLIDLGIAAPQAELERPDGTTGTVVGTLEYMAPEVASQEPYDHRADLYSLGLVLYELLAGELPFEGQQPFTMAFLRVSKPIPATDDVSRTELLPGLGEVVDRALARDPAQRWQTAEAMRGALERVLAREAI